MSELKYKGISPNTALNWAVSMALSEAVVLKLFDYDTMIKLSSRADDLYQALMRGDMVEPQPDGTMKIRKRPPLTKEDEAALLAEGQDEDDTLVLGGKK